ncbi:hypothetical protein FUA23_20855 [Neolewinella aurantiaca]|uniref:UbiA prenyltransferase family protein n=1 Tax=Neolewinella aurantiaca TaxID=2602767 RepID=A0A5C7FIA7_9BACT|nr:hypothetical protein [Neolewinella aurantiaca]TXF85216.1 hypothetical protein FUA23_20855 [Neolewinella aurantiaca]
MFFRRIFNWVFYGHVWIALAATALSLLSVRLVYGPPYWASEWPVLLFVFCATLGVYTMHRYLSWQRAGERPTSQRYEIVEIHPQASLFIGGLSLAVAGGIGLFFIDALWSSLLWALPITVFYLTPPIKGWRRLRDLPYVKVLWVGIAWSIVTVEMPVQMISDLIAESYARDNQGIICVFGGIGTPQYPFGTENIVRLLFTMSVALLFDFRDVVLDRSQSVKTMAGAHPVLTRWLVTAILMGCAAIVYSSYGYEDGTRAGLIGAYLAGIGVAWLTNEGRSENWYAVVVNGLLLAPPIAYLLLSFWGADAGAGLG